MPFYPCEHIPLGWLDGTSSRLHPAQVATINMDSCEAIHHLAATPNTGRRVSVYNICCCPGRIGASGACGAAIPVACSTVPASPDGMAIRSMVWFIIDVIQDSPVRGDARFHAGDVGSSAATASTTKWLRENDPCQFMGGDKGQK